jgi:hypothetical protein
MMRSRLLPSLLLTAAMAAPAVASAQVGDQVYEESPKWFSTGMSFGMVWLNDDQLVPTYGTKARFVPKLSFGFVPWSRYVHVEISSTVGFQQFFGTQVFVDDQDEEATGSSMMMTIVPVTVDLTVGLDLLHEQPIVPYGGIGLAMAFWRENETGGGPANVGDRYGFNVIFGLELLMDAVDKSRAQALDVSIGINDSYFTIEGRWADVKTQIRNGTPTTDGLHFGGWSVVGGLKVVY